MHLAGGNIADCATFEAVMAAFRLRRPIGRPDRLQPAACHRSAFRHQKHNLNMRAVRATTQSKMPGGKRQQLQIPSRWEYDTIAYEVKCSGMLWWRTCKKHNSKRVRAVVPYVIEPDEYVGTFGVITAFCMGMNRCPPYVKNAVNIR